MSRKTPSQFKNLNDTHDLMTLMTHAIAAQVPDMLLGRGHSAISLILPLLLSIVGKTEIVSLISVGYRKWVSIINCFQKKIAETEKISCEIFVDRNGLAVNLQRVWESVL